MHATWNTERETEKKNVTPNLKRRKMACRNPSIFTLSGKKYNSTASLEHECGTNSDIYLLFTYIWCSFPQCVRTPYSVLSVVVFSRTSWNTFKSFNFLTKRFTNKLCFFFFFLHREIFISNSDLREKWSQNQPMYQTFLLWSVPVFQMWWRGGGCLYKQKHNRNPSYFY